MNENQRKILLIDIDDVLVECFELPLINKYLKTNYTLKDFEYPDARVQDIFKTEQELIKFYTWFEKQQTYADNDIVLIKDAVSALKQLNELYKLYLLSDWTIWQRPTMASNFANKYNFLLRHFPFIHPEQYIVIHSKSKHLVHGDIIIDDRPLLNSPIKTKILFTAYRNKHLSKAELKKLGLIRADSWHDVLKLLLK